MTRCRPTPSDLPLAAAIAFAFAGSAATAASFTITTASTTAQTLGTAAGQTGSISAAGSLTLGGSTNAVTISGNNATLTNLGSIVQTGTGRAIRDNTGVTGLVVTNGSITNSSALMQTALGDVIQMNVPTGSVVLNNYGQMISLNGTTTGGTAGGSQVIDFNAITTGANAVNNYGGAVMTAYEADAVRTGVNGSVYNAGTIRSITTAGSSSDGIDAQTNSGASITNDAGGLIDGGRHGITGGAVNASATFAMGVTNNAGATIRGSNGSGINIDGFNGRELVTVFNAGTIVGNGVTGDGDGVDVDGLVNLTNTATGIIRSTNAVSASGIANSEGMSVGGGTITNAGLIEGLVAPGNTNAVGRGISIVGNDLAGSTTGEREPIYGNTVVTNLSGGVIRGQSDSAIYVGGGASGFTVTINNNAGALLQGGGTTTAALQTGADNDTVVNAGTIDGRSSGKAIALGGGDNTLRIVGGSAVVLGDIDGGTGGINVMTVEAGAGNRFAYAGTISNFARVELRSGTFALSGRVDPASTLVLAGGTLSLSASQSFASLVLSANASIALGGTSITFGGLGSVASGATLAVTGAQAGAFRLLGDQSGNADFQALLAGLTIDGMAATYSFDGTYTGVSAVPEPATLALLLAGIAVVGGTARRRRASAG